MTTARKRASANATKAAASRRRRGDPLVKAEQQRQIVRWFVQGASCDAIAERLKLSTATVYRVRKEALIEATEGRDVAVAQYREIELQRLDRLQQAHWQAAISGNVGSSKIILQCVDKRAKLLGLYAPLKVDAKVRSELDAQIEALMEELEDNGLAVRPK